MKSFRPQDEISADDPPPDGPNGRNAEADFRGEKRSNAIPASTTDLDALLYRKSAGTGAKLCYMGHVLMENCHGLVVDVETTRVSGHAERLAVLEMIDGVVEETGARRVAIGADKGYDTRDFAAELRERGHAPRPTPHAPRRPEPERRRSMAGPPAIPATPSACASENGSRRCSAG